MRFCADMLGLTTAEVTAVATFYTMYRRKPSGDYQVGRLHQHPVRGDGRRRDLRRAPGAPRRRQRRDHRRRQGHPGAHRVQRGLRLRPRRDGQLGVLRQPDRRVSAKRLVDDLRAGARGRPHPRARRCAPSRRPPASWPASPTTRDGRRRGERRRGSRVAGRPAAGQGREPRARGRTRATAPQASAPPARAVARRAPQFARRAAGHVGLRPGPPGGPVAEEGE